MRISHAVIAASFLSAPLAAQRVPERTGDSTIVAPTYAVLRGIYDRAATPAFAFTAGNVLDIPGGNATEIQATFLAGDVARVVAGTWGDSGKYGVEFYFRGDSLLFSYESFEYIAEAAPQGQWMNFKKLPAWERRIFWRNREAAFVESSGCSARVEPGEVARLLRTATTLRAMMKVPRS
jgi:hypothetical protein